MRHTNEPPFSNEKKPSVDPTGPQIEILQSLNKINDELNRINSHKLLKIYASIPQLLLFFFIKGIVFGLGTVVGATIVVSILAYALAQFEFIPVIGEWVKLISDKINSNHPS